MSYCKMPKIEMSRIFIARRKLPKNYLLLGGNDIFLEYSLQFYFQYHTQLLVQTHYHKQILKHNHTISMKRKLNENFIVEKNNTSGKQGCWLWKRGRENCSIHSPNTNDD